MANTKNYGRHKYQLVHKPSTYVPLNSNLEHRLLLLVGWPLSSFLQLERFLNFLLGIHRNAHSDRLLYCYSLSSETTQVCQWNTPISQRNQRILLCCTRRRAHTLGIRASALNVCSKTRTITTRTAIWVLHRKVHATKPHALALICRWKRHANVHVCV